jgi:hypothetical protein
LAEKCQYRKLTWHVLLAAAQYLPSPYFCVESVYDYMSTGFEIRHLSKIKQDSITKEWPLARQKEKGNCEQYRERGRIKEYRWAKLVSVVNTNARLLTARILYCRVHTVHNQGTVYYTKYTVFLQSTFFPLLVHVFCTSSAYSVRYFFNPEQKYIQ